VSDLAFLPLSVAVVTISDTRDFSTDTSGALIVELLTAAGHQIGASTIQSRASAALCDKTLFFVLPGSRAAVRLALERIILPQLDRRTKPCNFAELMPRF
jgi:molybdopterin biosynthesis enzyme MoaB